MRQSVTRYFDPYSKVIFHWYEVAREGKLIKGEARVRERRNNRKRH